MDASGDRWRAAVAAGAGYVILLRHPVRLNKETAIMNRRHFLGASAAAGMAAG
ncbi:MAG: twin-arginine translocation signal domain-containing protein, partial [bacterium]|nr:twin-arginine translocation signal domain-containing protein [bacterium]